MLTKSRFKSLTEKIGVTINGDRPFDIQVRDGRLYKKGFAHPSLILGEGYMEGYWDCDCIDELVFLASSTEAIKLDNNLYSKLLRLGEQVLNFQNRKRSKYAVEHYNLSNDFFRAMLGETMAYTCAYWKDATTLDEAQYAKFDLICRKMYLKKGDRVLDLGCGWGSLAKFMAEKYECEVVGVNISTEQVSYAQKICKELPVKIVLSDYRDNQIYNPKKCTFDKVVSVGLCEHIGPKNYQTFFSLIRENLKEDGLFLLHTIGKNDSKDPYDPWIDKYIFPNGCLPTIQLLSTASECLFALEDFHNFGVDYDKTLMAWHKNFKANWPNFKDKYGEVFYRMWSYYLLICAGRFRARCSHLWQMVFSPKGVLGGYKPVR